MLNLLESLYTPHVPQLSRGRDVSIPILALGKVGFESPLAAELLSKLVEEQPDGSSIARLSNPQELANTLYGLGLLQEACGFKPDPEQLDLLADEVVYRLRDDKLSIGGFKSQGLSNALYGCAKLGYKNVQLIKDLADAHVEYMPALLNSQDVANSLYALALLGCSEPDYHAALLHLRDAAILRLRSKGADAADANTEQGLSNTLWALGKLGCSGPEYDSAVLALCEEVQLLLKGSVPYPAQGLSNVLLGLAYMGRGGPAYQPAVQAVCSTLSTMLSSPRCEPQHIANSLYALVIMGLTANDLGEAAGLPAAAARECLRRRFAGFNGQNLANTAWALPQLGYKEPTFFAEMETAMKEPGRRAQVTAVGKTQLIQAFQRAGLPLPASLAWLEEGGKA